MLCSKVNKGKDAVKAHEVMFIFVRFGFNVDHLHNLLSVAQSMYVINCSLIAI